MSRLTLSIVSLLLLVQVAYSQDLIVTTKGDSIQCRITKSEEAFTHFTLKYGEEYRNTLIFNSNIQTIQKGYFSSDLIPDEELASGATSSILVHASGGWANRTAKVASDFPSDLREYIEELKTGVSAEAGAHIYMSETIGYGLVATTFHSSNEIASIDVSDDITISYIGPSVQTRLMGHSDKFHFLTSTSLGYLKYHDDSRAGGPLTIEGSTLGLRFALKLAFPMDEKFGVLIGAAYQQGLLTKITVSSGSMQETFDLDGDKGESLNRIDLNVGIYFSN